MIFDDIMNFWMIFSFLLYFYFFTIGNFQSKISVFLRDQMNYFATLLYTKQNHSKFLTKIFFQIIDSPLCSWNRPLLLSGISNWSHGTFCKNAFYNF